MEVSHPLISAPNCPAESETFQTLYTADLLDRVGFQATLLTFFNRNLHSQAPPKLFEEWKNRKKQWKDHRRSVQKNVSHLWEPHRDLTYEKNRQSFFAAEKIKELMRDICKRCLQGTRYHGRSFVDVDLAKLPGLRSFHEYLCALFYRDFVKAEKPDFGDLPDNFHAVFLNYVNYFVTADRDFLECLRWIPGQKSVVMSLEEFRCLFCTER